MYIIALTCNVRVRGHLNVVSCCTDNSERPLIFLNLELRARKVYFWLGNAEYGEP